MTVHSGEEEWAGSTEDWIYLESAGVCEGRGRRIGESEHTDPGWRSSGIITINRIKSVGILE